MKIKIHTKLTDRRGAPIGNGTTLGDAIVSIIDSTSVGAIQAAGSPRLLARVAERIDHTLHGSGEPRPGAIDINGEEEKALRSAIMAATNLQYFYHRKILAHLWPDELEDDERDVLLGEKPEALPAPLGGNGKVRGGTDASP